MADIQTINISAESIASLEDVKKGKPRKFVMVSKAAVVSLVVFKKGNFEKGKKEAKSFGKGNVSFGVVAGKGQDIRFILARSDGFDSDPVKILALKGFLEESANFKCKPIFEIVDVAPLALDEDDPLVAKFLLLQTDAREASQTHPDVADQLNTLCKEIGGYLNDDLIEPATTGLSQLETLLAGLGLVNPNQASQSDSAIPAAAPTDGQQTSAPTSPNGQQDPAAKLTESVAKLKPLIEKAIQLYADRKGDLIAAITQIRGEIRAEQFDAARGHTLDLAKLLKSLSLAIPSPATEAAPAPDAGLGKKLGEAVVKFKPLIEAAIKRHPDRKAELIAAIAQIRGEIKSEQFDPARAHTLELGKLLKELASSPPAAPPPPPPQATAGGANTAQLQAAFEKLLPTIQAVRTSHESEQPAIDGSLASFQSLMQDGKLDDARGVLLNLGKFIKSLAAGAKSAGQLSLVQLGKARLEWLDIWRSGVSEIERLKNTLLEMFRDDAKQAGQLAVALKDLDDTISQIDNTLSDRLDEVINANYDSRPKLIASAKAIIERLNASLSTPLMLLMDDNDVVPGMLVVAPLRAKLQEISAALG